MRVKEYLRRKVALFASVIEIAISIIVLIAIVIAGIQVVREVFSLAGNPKAHEGFTVFLGHAFNLIIGVEFIKMLAKHTPGSAIEVLLFAIARQMVVEHTSPLENLIGIVTIALIFAIRKFLFVPSFGEHSAFHEEEETRAGALTAAGVMERSAARKGRRLSRLRPGTADCRYGKSLCPGTQCPGQRLFCKNGMRNGLIL